MNESALILLCRLTRPFNVSHIESPRLTARAPCAKTSSTGKARCKERASSRSLLGERFRVCPRARRTYATLDPPFLFVVVAAGCDSTIATPTPIVRPSGPSAAPPPTPATRVELGGDTSGAFVGRRLHLEIEAKDQSGNPVSSDIAQISVSNESVASVTDLHGIPVRTGNSIVTDMQFTLALTGAGETTLEIQVGDGTLSMTFDVAPSPPLSHALVVDSFSVAEFRVTCAWNCPYLEYAPLLYLREPTGNTTVEAVAIEVTIPTMTTGLCSGAVYFGPGTSRLASYTYSYTWSNDVFFVSLDGTPVPDGPATARVIVRDAAGTFSRIEATGPIIRSAPGPTVPTPVNPIEEWLCQDENWNLGAASVVRPPRP